jgi:hypothetical protein
MHAGVDFYVNAVTTTERLGTRDRGLGTVE